MTRLVISSASFLLLAGSSFAADVVDQPPSPPIAQSFESPVSDWSGFYGGVYGGYGFGGNSTAEVRNAVGVGLSNRSFTDGDGFLGGVFGGYQLQSGSIVYGIESDVEVTGMNDTRAVLGGGSASFDLHLQGSLRARLGYDIGFALLYGTAGLAVGDIEYSGIAADGSGGSDGTVELGYVLGAGADVEVTERLFLRSEYRWTDYTSESFTTASGVSFDMDTRYHSARVGVGIKF